MTPPELNIGRCSACSRVRHLPMTVSVQAAIAESEPQSYCRACAEDRVAEWASLGDRPHIAHQQGK